jgi:hypothetical protein
MMPPLSAKEKLQIQFRKSLRRGYTKNVELDPVFSEGVAAVMEPEETAIVRVASTKGQHYWFTDRRLLSEHDGSICELVRYQSRLARSASMRLTTRLGAASCLGASITRPAPSKMHNLIINGG